jgi:predicted acyl esterase
MHMGRVLLLFALLTLAALAGCFGDKDDDGSAAGQDGDLVPVQDRHLLPYNVTGFYSHTVQAGPFGKLQAQSVFVPVTLPPAELGAANDPTNPPRVHLGLFLPEVPTGTKVPVIADIGPYYGDSDDAAIEPAHRLGGFLIDNFVPHGYAVAQVSVFGSGLSNHCMDLMGTAEQLGIDAAVEWLGTQDWSNGNVALIGRSYDGSTPWEAATFGNPHLKTIVPISGLIGMHELMWRNGTSETRGPIMHNVVYGTFGIDQPEAGGETGSSAATLIENTQTLCPDYLAGPVEGVSAYVTGDYVAPQANQYWRERSFLPRALENYNGSVYLIHGLQDWNVDPHMAFPTYQLLEGKGLEVKGLFGQWNHMYPDRPSEHVTTNAGRGHEAYPESVRYDWAQDLLEWFDHYLMGTGPKPDLHVEVQDNHGAWRVESTYPPTDATAVEFLLGTDDLVRTGGNGIIQPASGLASGEVTTYRSHPVADELRLAGLHQLRLGVRPVGSGGQVFAELRDATLDLRLGHAIMDLRFASGGTTMQSVTPGESLTARMEFEAFDAVVPAGHVLELRLSATGEDYLPSSTSSPVLIEGGVLRLFDVERGPEAFFTPPAWSGEAEATAQQP